MRTILDQDLFTWNSGLLLLAIAGVGFWHTTSNPEYLEWRSLGLMMVGVAAISHLVLFVDQMDFPRNSWVPDLAVMLVCLTADVLVAIGAFSPHYILAAPVAIVMVGAITWLTIRPAKALPLACILLA